MPRPRERVHEDHRRPGRPARQARPRPVRPQRPARRDDRSPTTAASARRCRRSRSSADAGAKVVVVAHLGRPKGAPEEKYSLRAGRRADVRAARHGRRVRHRHGRRLGEGRRRRARRRRRRDPGEHPLQRGRDEQGRGRARRVRRRSSPPWRTSFVSDGFGVVHRKQASVYDVAQRLPHAMGGLVLDRGRGAQAAHRRPGSGRTPSCSAARRSPTSSGSSTTCIGKADRLLIGGGMVFTFLAAQGHEIGTSLLEADQIDTVQGLPRDGRRARRRGRAAGRHRRRGRVRRRRGRTRSSRPTRSPTGRSAWTSARSRRALRGQARRREDRVLERPDGRLRVGGVQPPAPVPSRRPSPRSTASPSSAAATPPRPCARWASTRRRSGTSRPAAARRWSTWRARPSPASHVLED